MLIDEVYRNAVKVIRRCCTKNGLYASVGGYTSVWARDSMISFLGASLVKNDTFKKTFKKSLETLAKYQSELGQIPNNVDIFSDSKTKNGVSFATIDSSLWFIIGEYVYYLRYKDKSLLKKYKENIRKALLWVKYQDAGEDLLPEQQPTTDWQDAFPHKYGHTINTQALYYKVLNLMNEKKLADKVKKTVNEHKERKLFNGKYYSAFRWKNHDKIKEEGDWFDSLGNLLAVIFELCNKENANKILNYIENKKINKPFPVRAIDPPITKRNKYWQDYYETSGSFPYKYLNGGVWPFIGGFYICALVKMKRFKEAKEELIRLAEGNNKGNFSEWMDGRTGKPGGGEEHAWDAGVYILAYESVKRKKCLI
ncbi:hypothetical protein HYV88_02290 [Candidatus Woesearchaeota archaeon]|nr:hypothetical protein [Candidatus Woesearchaeota archaeon]